MLALPLIHINKDNLQWRVLWESGALRRQLLGPQVVKKGSKGVCAPWSVIRTEGASQKQQGENSSQQTVCIVQSGIR